MKNRSQQNKQSQIALNNICSEYKPHEVNFVAPDLDDVKVYMDLYLMYESNDPRWHEVQAIIFEYFNKLLKKYRSNSISDKELINNLYFPEVQLIGFGHCKKGTSGRGSHYERGEIIKSSIFDDPNINKVGIKTLAKMSIQIEGIGPDLLSDLVGNFSILNLLEYTKEQVETYNLKTMKVPVARAYDISRKRWIAITEVDLPYFEGDILEPRILVPKHICRKMPILSTDEFYKGFLKYILQDEEIARIRIVNSFGEDPKVKISDIEERLKKQYKSISGATREIVKNRPELIKNYTENPYKYKSKRKPKKSKINWDGYIKELKSIKPGVDASEFVLFLKKVFEAMYGNNLLRGKIEKRSVDKIFRYDVNFLNASQTNFFKIVQKQGIKSGLLIIEAKNYNKSKVANKEFNQSLAYTIKNAREIIFLVKRESVNSKDIEKSKRHFLSHKIIIMPLSDEDIIKMLQFREISENSFDDFLNKRLQEILSA